MARFTVFSGISTTWSPTTVKAKVRGGALATQASRSAALTSQMRVLPHGRRVVGSVGLQGQVTFCVVDGTDPDGTGTQIYPLQTSARIMDRGQVHLTPGYRLAVKAVTAKSGPVQFPSEGAVTWYENGAYAALEVSVTMARNGASTTTSKIFYPTFSSEDYKALLTGSGAAFGDLQEFDHVFHTDSLWTENVTASWVVTAYGGVRPVDVCLYETPYRAVHDASAREGTCPSFAAPGDSQEFAITGKDFSDDAVWGSVQSNKSARDQERVWGPRLFAWSSWNEDAIAVTATEALAVSITSTSFRDLKESTVTGWASSRMGWSMSSGGYGRRIDQSGILELRDKIGALPVKLLVYARMTTAGPTGTVRFTTSPASCRDLTISGTSYAWYTVWTTLACAIHATAPSHLMLLVKVSSGTMEIRYASCEYWDNYEVTE